MKITRRKLLLSVAAVAVATAAVAWITSGVLSSGKGALVLYGNIDDRQVNLPFQISERVKSVHVEEGTQVKKGDLIAELETIRLINDVRSAEAEVASATANLEKVKNGPRAEEIAMARAEVAAASAKIKAAESDYRRQQKLQLDSVVSKQTYENAEAQYLLLKALRARQESNLEMLLAGSRREDIAAAEARLAAAEAELVIRKQRLADAELYSPCDGIVRNRILEPGEMATPQTPAVVIAVVSPKWIRVYLEETALPQVKLGDAAKIDFDGMDRSFDGWVGYISPTAEFTPKNVESTELRTSLVYEMRVFVKDPENLLKLGAPATVTFPVQAKK